MATKEKPKGQPKEEQSRPRRSLKVKLPEKLRKGMMVRLPFDGRLKGYRIIEMDGSTGFWCVDGEGWGRYYPRGKGGKKKKKGDDAPG